MVRWPWARRARFLALLLVGAGSIALGVLTWRTSTAGPSRRLVRDIHSRASAHFPRPSHLASPVPGTFGTAAAGPWDALTEREALSVDVELCRAVRDGEQPFSAASPSCLREMAGAAAEVAGLLEATHRSEAGPVPGLGTLDDSSDGARARSWSTLPYAAKLAALRLRAELDTAQAPQALNTCVDLLALARDASWGTGLAGRLPASGVTEVAFRPCVAAIDAAPAEARLPAVEALRRIEAGTPDLATVLGEYALGVRARAFAPYVPTEGLPPAVQVWAGEGAVHDGGPLFALRLGDTWHRIEGTLADVVAAARLPVEQRVARLDQLSVGEKPFLNPAARYAFPQLGRAARTDARARSQVRLLRAALAAEVLRARQGRWPTAAELGAELGPSPDGPLAVEPHGDALTLADPTVPRGELVATVRAGPR